VRLSYVTDEPRVPTLPVLIALQAPLASLIADSEIWRKELRKIIGREVKIEPYEDIENLFRLEPVYERAMERLQIVWI
jgi:hypothetical protein